MATRTCTRLFFLSLASLVCGAALASPAYRVFVDTLSYLDPSEIALIVDAYRFSEKAHQGQKRLSGEPYITHPLAVAGALAEWRMDAQAIIAALLHDVMEDTAVSKAEITARFGTRSASMMSTMRRSRAMAISILRKFSACAS